jgi:hypothetical protein
VVAICASAAPATAQTYFGRNKIQYEDFKFEVLRTEHFDIYFYPEERDGAEKVGRLAERWRARLGEIFGHELTQPQPIVLYASSPHFQQTNVVQGIGEGTGGVTEGLKRRVALPLAGSLAETDHVLGHELVHAFQYDIASRQPDDSAGSALERLPLWFVEGMAEYLSLGYIDANTAMWIRDAAREGKKLPTIGQLGDPRYFPYRWGQALWAYLAGRWGDDIVEQLFRAALHSGSTDSAFDDVLKMSAKQLSQDWHEVIRAQYQPILEATQPADAYGRGVTDQSRERALNVGPSLSPEGKRVAYLSERDLLSVDLYVADADTGRVLRKLTNTAVDAHLSSLQFISSAGSWHPAGRQFVIGAIREGRPALAIFDVDSGERVREIPFADLGEILSPSWSPDGRLIAFSATKGGFADLFIYDLENSSLRQITSDAFADLQPAWSSDSRRLAFVTDRFSTDLSTLHAGKWGLALFDYTSGEIRSLQTFDRGKSINPQWAPDGRHLFFLSDQSGITNIYVLDIREGGVRQVTNLVAGASGIVALSPALSSSLDARRLAFSGYDEGRLSVYVIDNTSILAGTPVVTGLADGSSGGVPGAAANLAPPAAVLPPATRVSDRLVRLLSDPAGGLPQVEGSVVPYRPKLLLDFVGQPYLGAGVDRFGTMVGGGLSFLWSDMLGNHSLAAVIDANTSGGFSSIFKNTGGLLAYQDLTKRWSWGIAAEQVPYLAGGFSTGVTTSGGQRVLTEQTIIQRQTYRGLNGGVAYPFNQTRRLEFGTGYQQVSFDQEVRTVIRSLQTGRVMSDRTDSSALADTLHLGTASAALVFDNSVFGATSPVAGGRARLELAPTTGSLSFMSTLADYRRYFMPASFYTIAGRVMHYGRYRAGSEDSRMLPLFIGYPDLVRGYQFSSFTADECVAGPSGSCESFDRLLGSRMLIGNLELRLPLLRPFGVRSGMYGPLPIEVALFTDAGVAWSRSDSPSFFGGDRRPVSSAGLTLRANLFGFTVAQIDLAYPFQRPGRGWVWGFSLTPGF